jgi:hypothetical protein
MVSYVEKTNQVPFLNENETDNIPTNNYVRLKVIQKDPKIIVIYNQREYGSGEDIKVNLF